MVGPRGYHTKVRERNTMISLLCEIEIKQKKTQTESNIENWWLPERLGGGECNTFPIIKCQGDKKYCAGNRVNIVIM